ncbi:hypothetical protein PISMIDRAFT_682318 [Pisolithus microcarpus 441]|uniref:Uncharacterized protein n=1 Tax=Pisolithus microcarpus 441 TaxID=765257 RepID=A0A0C9ZKR9_9AGAM|nr:hypothetical protein PISMIDRAFT_682318 [Pisolithus microcarpus 441]
MFGRKWKSFRQENKDIAATTGHSSRPLSSRGGSSGGILVNRAKNSLTRSLDVRYLKCLEEPGHPPN